MRTTMTGGTRQRGFTLIELMISVMILASISYVVFRITASAGKVLRTNSLVAQGQRQAMDLARMIEVRLRNSSLATIQTGTGGAFADPGTSTNGIRFRMVIDYQGAQVVGPSVGFQVFSKESNITDTLDNDRDNVVDEVDLMHQEWNDDYALGPADRQVVAGRDLRDVTIVRRGKHLTITVRTQYYDPVDQQLRTFTGSSALTVRNP